MLEVRALSVTSLVQYDWHTREGPVVSNDGPSVEDFRPVGSKPLVELTPWQKNWSSTSFYVFKLDTLLYISVYHCAGD